MAAPGASRVRLAVVVSSLLCAALPAAADRQLTREVEAQLCSAAATGSLKVRLQAAIVLGRAGGPGAVPCLSVALDDEELGVRGAAALALGNLGSVEAIGPLAAHAEDPDGFVRDHIRSALLSFRDPEALPRFLAASRDAGPHAREWLVEAVAQLPGAEAEAALGEFLGSQEPDVQKAAERAIEQLSPERRDPCILAAMRSRSETVRARAAELAGTTRVFTSIDRLLALAQDEGQPLEVRGHSKRALYELRGLLDDGSLSATVRGEGTPVRRARAVQLIGIRGGPQARDLLLVGLADPEPQVRLSAAHALLDLGDTGGGGPIRQAAEKEQDEGRRKLLEGLAAALDRGERPAWRGMVSSD